MDKRFDPSAYEGEWQRRWREARYFEVDAQAAKKPFTIMIPPPNVTGKLHMGHALQSTLQDLLTRWRRMRGENALWLPGTDHAGIATQLMVERQLESEGTSRVALGREKFLERMWQWTREHHGNIRAQLDRLGASCDWSRERFTLDEGLSRAVREAFVRLYREGLIHRGEYMVNWSPGLDTAISDLEVEMRTVEGKLYHIAYPLEGSDERIVVATTRPETMLGDTAIAFHPDDERYQGLRGRYAVLPLVGRRLPFVADAVVEKDFGTGLVKVTPAHDPADFEIGQRHDLDIVQVIDRRGAMTEAAGEELAGLDREEARRRVVERLRAEGLLVKVERYTHNVGFCQRSGVAIEPLISTQWFLDVSAMAARALAAVGEGRLVLIPDSWVKTWEHWLENIRPWCISRQLWWGHQIPAWYDPAGAIYVAHDREEAVKLAGTDQLTQDPDVLDTWFSSGLWPFSTLGWPDQTPDLEIFYPTDVLITGFDILFFWVARMVMMGLHLTGEVPFHTVHLTGLVRDAEGRKMSKTKGNTVDPMDLVEEYGADALRFTLAVLDSPGRDIPLDPERMAGYRAFGNKIWNAVRFALARTEGAEVAEEIDVNGLAVPERWILSRLSATAAEVNEKLETFRFDEACNRLYHFFWGELCDWYLEIAKPALGADAAAANGAGRPRVAEVLLSVLDRSLRLLHPMMPFLTEELWQRLPGHEAIHPETICLAPFPVALQEWSDPSAERQMGGLIEIVSRIRSLRSDLGIEAKEKPAIYVEGEAGDLLDFLRRQESLLGTLARADEIHWQEAPEETTRVVVRDLTIGVVVPERARGEEDVEVVRQELASIEQQLAHSRGLLANEQFVAKAPEAVVVKARSRLAELEARRAKLLGEDAAAQE